MVEIPHHFLWFFVYQYPEIGINTRCFVDITPLIPPKASRTILQNCKTRNFSCKTALFSNESPVRSILENGTAREEKPLDLFNRNGYRYYKIV
jgi:hypothetical protein